MIGTVLRGQMPVENSAGGTNSYPGVHVLQKTHEIAPLSVPDRLDHPAFDGAAFGCCKFPRR